MRRVLAAAVAILCTLATATACSDDSDGGGSDDVKTIEITFSGDTVTPSGERVEVDANQPIDLVVTADAPGEIHVHSEPEHTISYSEGTETFEIAIDKPGVVEVESHNLDEIIVQLEVS